MEPVAEPEPQAQVGLDLSLSLRSGPGVSDRGGRGTGSEMCASDGTSAGLQGQGWRPSADPVTRVREGRILQYDVIDRESG